MALKEITEWLIICDNPLCGASEKIQPSILDSSQGAPDGWHRLFDHCICPKCWKESGREQCVK